MSVSIDLNIFPVNKLIETLEFFKERNIDYDVSPICNLVKDKRSEEIEYLLENKYIIIKELVSYYNYDDDDRDSVEFLTKIHLEKSEEPGKVLVYAIKMNIEQVKFVLKSYTDDIDELLNYQSGKPLITACQLGNIDIVELLLKSGAKIDECKHDPIIDALVNNNTIIAKYLLGYGSNLKNISQKHIEKMFKNKSVYSILFIMKQLEDGYMEHLDDMDWTQCLKYIAIYGFTDVLEMLVNMDIDISKDYKNLIKISEKNRNFAIAHYLRVLYDNDNRTKRKIDHSLIKITKSGISFKK